jgi:hypothetical protein
VHIGEFRRRLDTCRRHVLKLECYNVDAAGKLAHLIEVVVRRARFEIGDLAGRRARGGRIGVHAIAHLTGLDGEHPPELPAAEHTDSGIWRNDLRHRKSKNCDYPEWID